MVYQNIGIERHDTEDIMKKKFVVIIAAVLLVAALTGCLVACDEGGKVDLTECNAIVDRLNEAGYSVTSTTGSGAFTTTGSGTFASFDGISVEWSIYGYKTSASGRDMVTIAKFSSDADLEKYQTAFLDIMNDTLAASGLTQEFSSWEELDRFYKEEMGVPLGFEFRDSMFIYAVGSGASDAFGE